MLQPCFGQCLLRYSMTTAASAHLVVLANENGGGFNVQPGQQQAGGTVEQGHRIVTLQTDTRRGALHLQTLVTCTNLDPCVLTGLCFLILLARA